MTAMGAKRTRTPAGELLERSLANSAGVVTCEADDQGDLAIMKLRSRNQSDCRQVSHREGRSEWFMARRVSRRAKVGRVIRRTGADALPDFVPPQLTALTEAAPEGREWAHELKWDGYRMHARINRGNVRLLTGRGSTARTSTPPSSKRSAPSPLPSLSRWRALRAL